MNCQKTVSMPENLMMEIQDRANVTRRSFSKMVVYMLEQQIKADKKYDYEAIRLVHDLKANSPG